MHFISVFYFHFKETVPFGMQVAKVNGNIKYRLSDLHFPQQHSGNKDKFKRKWGQCYTITPDDAIQERIAQLEEKSKLKVTNAYNILYNFNY